jgi:hypothetical protein
MRSNPRNTSDKQAPEIKQIVPSDQNGKFDLASRAAFRRRARALREEMRDRIFTDSTDLIRQDRDER